MAKNKCSPQTNSFYYILQKAKLLYKRIVVIRRHLHSNPELSNHEYATASYLMNYLQSLGVPARYCVGKRGVAATISNGLGKTVVLRADIDALAVEEKNRVPYKSRICGLMHACGHDIHSASLLGAIEIITSLKHLWKGKVVALFQPSEEAEPSGALRMIKEGVFPVSADAVFGLHVDPDLTEGQVGLKSGHDFASVTLFKVIVRGKGGHGATPEKTIDPIACAASMILALRKHIAAAGKRQKNCMATVGKINAGTKANIIPEEACFEGTLRTFTTTDQKRLKRRLCRLFYSIAKSAGASVEVIFGNTYPAGFNNYALTRRCSKVFAALLGKCNILELKKPSFYAEDFSYYQKLSPGLYVHLGVRPNKKRIFEGIHSPRFLPAEGSIITAMALHAAVVMEICGTHSVSQVKSQR